MHPRSEVFGTALPTNMDGSLRPIMAPNARWLTVHHVGAGAWGDLGDTPAEMRAIQAYASSPGKATPWEYNVVVDTAGEVWCYAGEYVAAHSAGENPVAIGVLLLINADTERPTVAMIDAVRKLRSDLTVTSRLALDHQMVQHRQMPGASTGCPGRFAIEAWPQLVTPWQPPTPTPEDTDMPFMWRDTRYANVFLVGSCPAQNISGKSMEMLTAKGVPLVVDQHDQFLATCLHQSGLDASALVPA